MIARRLIVATSDHHSRKYGKCPFGGRLIFCHPDHHKKHFCHSGFSWFGSAISKVYLLKHPIVVFSSGKSYTTSLNWLDIRSSWLALSKLAFICSTISCNFCVSCCSASSHFCAISSLNVSAFVLFATHHTSKKSITQSAVSRGPHFLTIRIWSLRRLIAGMSIVSRRTRCDSGSNMFIF